MKCAPVSIFVYDRPDNVRRTLSALAANTLAGQTDVTVFSDGGKNRTSWTRVRRVRHTVRQFAGSFGSLTLIERPENWYIERNITEGVAQVLTHSDRIIVLEDDIVTSPHYLAYMNDALSLYAAQPRVMHVSGFTNLRLDREFYFTPHMSGWGWGTWRDRWQGHFHRYETREEALRGLTDSQLRAVEYGGAFPCLRSLDRRPIPWDVCWELAIHRAGGLCLTPGRTMVRNVGLWGGTHFRASRLLQRYDYDREPLQRPLRLTSQTPAADPDIEQAFAEAITDWGIRYTPLGRVARRIYKAVTKR